jgi:type IV pilus assembly protein PilM
MFERVVLGLDIGSYSVKAAELRAGFRGVEFLRLEAARIPADATPEEHEATIQLFLEQKDLPRDFVVCALPTERVTQRHLRFPFSGAKKIAQAIPFELEEDLAFPLAGMVLTHDQVLARPERTDVLVVMSPRAEVEAYLGSMERIGLDPRIVEMEGAVLSNLCTYLNLADAGRLVLDIGHSKTNLSLLVDGKPVLLRSIPIAGHHFTEAIAKGLHLAYDAAEDYKHEHGVFEGVSLKPSCPPVQTILDRLMRETLRSIQSAIGDPLDTIAPTEILLVGGSARLEGLPHHIEERTGLPCSVLTVSGAEASTNALAAAGPPVFAQAAALALRGSTTARVTELDFRQGEFEYTPDLSGLSSQLRLALFLFILCLVLWPISLWSDLRTRRSQADALYAQLETICTQTFPDAACAPNPFQRIENEVRSTRELANHLGVTGNGLSALEVMRELSGRIAPELNISLRELKIERRSLLARGYSKDLVSVDRMKEALSQFEWFEDVRFTDVQTDPRRGGKTFSLTIKFREGT